MLELTEGVPENVGDNVEEDKRNFDNKHCPGERREGEEMTGAFYE